MSPTRGTCHSLTRHHWRRLTRSHVRPLKREPNYLAQMLGCHRRTIRAYRRLAKLAPRHYDPGVMERESQQREEDRKWRASWEPALEKVYGPPSPEEREAQRHADLLEEQPPRLHPNTQRAVDRQLAAYELWKAAGRLAFARYEEFQRRRPHDLPSLGKVAQILEIAFDFGWIATGRDWRNPEPEPLPGPTREEKFEADVARAYPMPSPCSSNSPPREDSTTPLPTPHQPSTTNPQPTAPANSPVPQPSTITDQPTTTTPSPPPPAPPEPAGLRPRRDAYASLSRQQRQQFNRRRSST